MATLPLLANDPGCRPGELEKYRVRSVSVNHPLKFLHPIQAQIDRVVPQLLVKVGPLFRSVDADADRKTLEKEFPLPSDLSSTLFGLQIATATVTNCADGELDVEYFVLSSQFLPSLNGTIESRRREATTPQDAIHAVESRTNHPNPQGTDSTAPKASTYQLTPVAGYNSSDHLFGGGRLRILLPAGSTGPLQSLNVEGSGSGSFHDVSAAMQGSPNPGGVIGSIDWQLGFHSQSLPTGGTHLRQNSLTGQVAVTTKPITPAGLLLRLGGLLDGGNMQSGFQTANLAADTVSSSGYGALKLYGGLTFGSKHQTFSSSYGIELGGTSAQVGLDWRKQLGDVSWDLWFPIGDHRPLQIETRFTAGGIQTSHGAMIPVGEKFFGGNLQQNFIPGDSWDFRANPVIRGIPAQSFFATTAGVGADRFEAFNLTAAPVIWHSALLPKEITGDQDFQDQLQHGWDTVESNIAATYTAKDPHAIAMTKKLPDAQSALDSLEGAVAAAKTASGTPSQEWSACNVAVIRAQGRVKSTAAALARDKKLTEVTYGDLNNLGEQLLPLAIDSCDARLNATLQNAAIHQAAQSVKIVQDAIESEHKQIDAQKASASAQRDLVYPKRVFGTILHDLNLWSVSPVGIFDFARIGPGNDLRGGLRYAAGGGLRVILVSHANFTVGYARNLHRRPGEGSGAIFFSIGITELLR